MTPYSIVTNPDKNIANQVNQQNLPDHHQEKVCLRDGEIHPVPAVFQEGKIRIALRIVHKLVVGQVIESELISRRQNGETAKPVGYDFIQLPVLEQSVMNRFVNSPGQLML